MCPGSLPTISACTQTSTRWLYDATYARLKNLQLGYNLPGSLARKAGLKNLKVYALAENPAHFLRA